MADVGGQVALSLLTLRAVERSRAIHETLGFVAVQIEGLRKLDGELGPELDGMLRGLGEVTEALGRLTQFLEARFDIAMEDG